jgi:hypothetical protein
MSARFVGRKSKRLLSDEEDVGRRGVDEGKKQEGLPKDGPVAFSVEQRTIPALFLRRWRYLVLFLSNLMP